MIYLDHHATTPLSREARDAMAEAMENAHGANPSSVHAAGRKARSLIETARARVARALGAAPRELVFTSGGTEAVHTCVAGVAGGLDRVGAVFVDAGAHPALRAACERAAAIRSVPIEVIPSGPGGAQRIDALCARLAATNGGLVAISLVQHETGAIAPLREIADAVRAVGGVVVVDAVQALGKVALDAPSTGAIAMAFSAHKIGGPTGVGASWLAGDARIRVDAGGGGQERGLRAGTENIVGIVGFGAAAESVPRRLADMPRIAGLRDRIERALRANSSVVVNGIERPRTATACHASMRGVAGEELVAAFDLEGICVSSGPACSSGRPGPSASMLATYPDEPWRASAALRVTLGPENTEADAATFERTWQTLSARFSG